MVITIYKGFIFFFAPATLSRHPPCSQNCVSPRISNSCCLPIDNICNFRFFSINKNIFIDTEKAKITDVIDWETAGIGNPWADAVLGAWWMSGECGGSEKENKAFIKGYNHGLSDKMLLLDINAAKRMNPYLDVLWYLNILWVRSLVGDNSQT